MNALKDLWQYTVPLFSEIMVLPDIKFLNYVMNMKTSNTKKLFF